MSVDPKVTAFCERLGEVIDIRSAIALLHWDQEVKMPPKAAPGRGQQLATLSALSHRLFTDDAMGGLLHALRDQADSLDADTAKLVSETLYDYERATKLPEKFVQTFAEEQSKAYQAWVKARETGDFATFQPNLETMIGLLRQQADYHGYEGSPYNALLQEYERGMTAEKLKAVFGELLPKQSALVGRILDAPQQPELDWLDQAWDEKAQWGFTLEVLKDMGYDFDAGRQDKSIHPFTTNFDLYDVRVTTRVHPRELFSCLTGSIHEGGHALYEQGFRDADRRSTLGESISLGIHESQSRMWENVIGRSLPFWKHYAPKLQAAHPGQLDGIGAEQIYEAINHVARTFIRVEADECTYNLHVILRFELEVALIEGDLDVSDIPQAWNEKMKDYLRLDVPDNTQGCLQDIHWSHGSMGYFPTYALGNLYAAQLFEAITDDVPNLWQDVESGNFAPLLGWLRSNVHEVGRRQTTPELIEHVTGAPLTAEPYLRYLEVKYGALYKL